MVILHEGTSTKVSTRTVQRRVNYIQTLRTSISGGDPKSLLVAEMNQLPKSERQTLMKEAGFNLEVPQGEGLAMKASLGIPWSKLRHLRRYKALSVHK